MNWFQRIGADFLGLSDYLTEQWGQDTFLLDPNSDFSGLTTDRLKIAAVFSNPAVLKVFKLQCDMFSLGEVYVYRNGKVVTTDPFLNLINNPNPFQQKSQFLWDYMFWKMCAGNGYCYVDSDSVASDSNKLYMLDTSKMYFPPIFTEYKDKLILSKATENLINEQLITYTYQDGTSIKIKWGRISHIADLSNGTGNWFKGNSTIDTLFEIIANSKAAPKSKNISVRYAGKYMVAGKADPNNVTQSPLGEDEKMSIEQKMNGYKTVHAIKSMVDIKRFIESGAIIGELDAAYWDDYFKIGSLFSIPREVLEASLKGATYENQETARGAHVDYTLQPAGNQLMASLAKRFGYTTKSIVMSWDHLPFTKALAKQKAETDKISSEALLNYMKAGIKLEEINSTLDTNFSELDYEPAKRATNTSGQNQTGSGQNA